MDIPVCGTAEYILFLIGLCGEVETDEIIDLEGTSRVWNMRVINQLLKDKIIKRHSYDTEIYKGAKEVLRLRDAKGEPMMEAISSELRFHYDLIRGKRGNRNKGDARYKDRTRKSSKISQTLYKTGMPVDMFTHTLINTAEKLNGKGESTSQNSYTKPKSIFTEEGDLLKPLEILERLGVNEEMYFSSKALARMNTGGNERARNLMSKAQGMLVKGNHILPVYYLQSANETWNKECEVSMMFTTNHFKRELGRTVTSEKGEAVFFIEEKDILPDFIFPSKKIKRAINPEAVYENAYMIPISENHEEIRQMILKENFHERSNELLLGENEIKGKSYDGMMEGLKIYNLLSSNIAKIKSVKGELKNGSAAVIIHQWQADLMSRMFGESLQAVILNEEEFYELVNRI